MFGRKPKRPKGQNDNSDVSSNEEKIQSAVESWLGASQEDEVKGGGGRGGQKKANRMSSKPSLKGSEVERKNKKTKSRKDLPKKEKSPEETQLFGIPITLAAKRSDPEHGLIPLPLRNAVRFLNEKSLEEEGLYRVPGSHSKYLEYKATFDAGEEVDFCEVEKVHQNVAMMVIKFLKDLPEPLYTNALTGHVKKTLYGVKDKAKQERNLRKVMGYLPLVNREVFRFLVSHLRALAPHRTEEHMNASILSWGISLGRTMGRLMEMLFEGSDELIPHTIIYGEEFEVAAQRSHKKGLFPSPIRFGVNALLTVQQESYENLIEKCLIELPEETIHWMDLRYILDGGCKSNPLLDQDPTDTFNLMCYFMHGIPGSIFTPNLPETLGGFLPSPGTTVDASMIEKVRAEVDQLPVPNYESLKLLAWFFNQLHAVEDSPDEKIHQMEVHLIGGPSTASTLFSFIVAHYLQLWPEIATEPEEAKEEANDGSGDEEPDVPEEEYPSEYPSSLVNAFPGGGKEKEEKQETAEASEGEEEESGVLREVGGNEGHEQQLKEGDNQTGSGLATPLLPLPSPKEEQGFKGEFDFLPKGEEIDRSLLGNEGEGRGEAFVSQYTFDEGTVESPRAKGNTEEKGGSRGLSDKTLLIRGHEGGDYSDISPPRKEGEGFQGASVSEELPEKLERGPNEGIVMGRRDSGAAGKPPLVAMERSGLGSPPN